jgi:hypothetical protein
MPRTANFSVTDLRNIFFEVLDRHADSHDAYVNVGSGFVTLAQQLDRLTALNVSGDKEHMADIMVMVTQLVCKDAPIVSMTADKQAIGALNWTAITEFSAQCAVYFAREQGFNIDLADIQLDMIARLLLIDDNWQQLKSVFHDSLSVAVNPRPEPESFAALEDGNGVGGARSDRDSLRPLARQLSNESYANLRSVADQMHWNDSELLRLIDEHMRPHLELMAVHYSETVSGEEWLALYDWLTSQIESMLCRVSGLSNQL